MEYRLLGRTGLKVSAFAFGTVTFGGEGYFSILGNATGETAKRQIDLCLDAGVNLFDTSNYYSMGRSEEVLGEALGKRRADVVVATKAGLAAGQGVNDLGTSRRHLIEACEASLRRLKTDWIDLYQMHVQDPLTPAEETVRALEDLVRSGKVRYVGCSNYSGWFTMKSLAAADRLSVTRFSSQQIQYSLLCRDAENELLPLGVDQGVGAMIYSPTASGYLSGKYRGAGPSEPTRLSGGSALQSIDEAQGARVLAAMDEIAAGRPGVSLSQIALNWVVRQAGVSAVIVGARTEDQLADNLGAASWSLTDEEIAALDAASAVVRPYPYNFQQQDQRFPAPRLQPPITPAA